MRISPIILLNVGLIAVYLGLALALRKGPMEAVPHSPPQSYAPPSAVHPEGSPRVPEQKTPAPSVDVPSLYGAPKRTLDPQVELEVGIEPAQSRTNPDSRSGRISMKPEWRSGPLRLAEGEEKERPREAVSTPEQILYDRLASSMRSARYAFNHPDTMYLARRSQITLALAEDENVAVHSLLEQFEKDVEGTIKTGETRYAPAMVATLRGKDFKIELSGSPERLVLLNRTGSMGWTWFVEPLEVGVDKLLVLELSARLARASEKLPPLIVKTFEARINVDVRPWDRVLIHAQRMSPVAQALTGAGGLVAIIGFIGTARRWLGRSKKGRRKSDASAMRSASSFTVGKDDPRYYDLSWLPTPDKGQSELEARFKQIDAIATLNSRVAQTNS